MHALGKRISLVQFRVRSPSQSSQVSGESHKPAVSGAAPETATIVRMKWQIDKWVAFRYLVGV